MRNRLSAALVLLAILAPFTSMAEEKSSPRGWYMGIEAGIPLSASSFSSFAPGGPYAGFGAGLFAGYNFNDFLALEADFGLGRSNLAARAGCIGNNYYLGADNVLYYSAPLGIDSWSVSEFGTGISFQHLGLSARLNLLRPARRWTLALSPRISLYGTAQTLYSTNGNRILRGRGSSDLHFGYGATAQVGYKLSERFHLALGSSLTSLTGTPLDGIPSHGHKTNLIWENSLRLSINLSVRKKAAAPLPAVAPGHFIASTAPLSSSPSRIDEPLPPQPGRLAELPARTLLPGCQTVYFEFDRWNLRPEECPKLGGILEAMLSDESLYLNLEGWCDRFGSDAVNEAISSLRAGSVKKWFVKNGIAPERIKTAGKGRDTRETVYARARRVEAEVQKMSPKNEQ